jgi:hypothetical protein
MKNTVIYILIVLAIGLALFIGCDKNVEPESDSIYMLTGILVKNQADNTVSAIIELESNEMAIMTANLKIIDSAFIFNSSDSTYRLNLDSLNPGTYYLKISDTGGFSDSMAFTVAGNFDITNIAPLSGDENPGGQALNLDWSTSLNSEGYVMAAVANDSDYVGEGWSGFVESGFTSGQLPVDAFRLSGDLDTGWYNIYVYSYTGAPLLDYNLPMGIPPFLCDIINRLYLKGSWGTVVISPRDSVHVVVSR